MLQLAVLVVALCGIAYELVIATVSSYLLGDSVYQFSLTIGLFMFAMGIGSFLTRRFEGDLVERFVLIEILVALFGGISSTLLFLVFPHYVWYRPTMYLLIIVIGVLVGLEIPILTRILSRKQSLKDSIANVLTLDYFGALIGSVAFPLVLLPQLGLFRSSFVIALLNITIAGLTVVAFGKVLRHRNLWLGATLATAAALIGGVAVADHLRAFAEDGLFADQVVHVEQTPYQRIVLTRSETSGRVRLFLDGHLQFAEQDEHRYHEALVHPVMAGPGGRADVLILGGGDGMAAREVLKYAAVERIDLVDIDPAMTRLCSTLPALKRINEGALDAPRLTVHHVDAFGFVRDTKRRYDRVIIDLPDPHNEALNKLYSVEFYRMVKRVMRPGAAVVTQSTSPFFTRTVYWSINRTLAAAGFEVLPYQITVPSFSVWGFNLARVGTAPTLRFDAKIGTRYLDQRVLTASLAFGKDSTPNGKEVINSIFEPKLYGLYARSVVDN